jgi:hypothetical protein
MFVINYYSLHTLERNVDDVFNVIEALIGEMLAPSLFQVEA